MESLKGAEIVKQQALRLMQSELFESAEILVSLYISSITNTGNSTSDAVITATSDLFELLGDVCIAKHEYRRALPSLRQALLQLQTLGSAQERTKRSSHSISSSDQAHLLHSICSI
jgi:hypothetical protein